MEYSNRPLVQKLVQFKDKNRFSFHVPGHKNGLLSNLPEGLRTALSYDWTELDGLDDLHEPKGVIQLAQDLLTKLYGSDQSYFLINGSTVGNLAMVYATCQKDEIVIVQRNAHKSIFNAIELTGAKPVFINPKWDDKSMTAGMVTTGQVKIALERYPSAKAVILTYPTYYGVTGVELKEIISVCHELKIPVLIDEAHGAHFVIDKPFPLSALSMGADIVVHSAHKTLPAMTMASYIHVRSDLIKAEKVAHYLKMLQSSSPSYLLLASLDDAREYVESFNEQDTLHFMKTRKRFIDDLVKNSSILVVETDDPLKIILRIKGYSGFEAQNKLNEIGIYTELADPFQVLFVLPLMKVEHSYPFNEIVERINGIIDKKNVSCEMNFERPKNLGEDISELKYTLSELEMFEVEWMPYEDAIGTVAATTITPYPPGIPLLLAGEKVTDVHIESLKVLFTLKARFHGTIKLEEKQILVVLDKVEE